MILRSKTKYKWRFKEFGSGSILMQPRLLVTTKNISIQKNVKIEKDAVLYSVQEYCGKHYNGQIYIGNGCYINHSLNVTCANSITIEDEVLIAYNVTIIDNNHGVIPKLGNYIMQQITIRPSIIIGARSWIGANCVIMASIGKGAVIAANTVVTKAIPDYCMVAGNPGRIVKKFNFDIDKWEKV